MPITITVPKTELFDDVEQKFINVKETTLTLEHSLVSLHKWEQKWKKPFLKEGTLRETGPEGILDYIRCMVIGRVEDENVFKALSEENVKAITEYLNDPMTATWFAEDKDPQKQRRRKKEVLTAEVIYWEMIALQIPMECKKWHLNSLLTLIRVVGIKNDEQYKDSQGKSKGKKPNLKSRAALNAQRRAALHTKG